MFKINISGAIISNAEGQTIFKAALKENLLIEHSCLNGRCRSCIAKVVEGKSEAISFEYGISEEEKSNNYILSCVRVPKTDMKIEVKVLDGVVFPDPKTIPAKIDMIEKINENLLYLTIRIPPSVTFDFLPGQYVNLILNKVKRSYSIARSDSRSKISFYIKRYENGIMSDFLFHKAKLNDILRIEGPLGSFFLRHNNCQSVIFLATGTGIAPIISILSNTGNLDYLKNKAVFLFHGVRFYDDFVEQEFLKSIDIKYVPVLSKERINGIENGYVQDICVQKEIDLSNSCVYACGSKKMIIDAKEKLTKAGLNLSNFHSDAFLESN